MRVTAPDGVEWTVERVWFSLPQWSRQAPDPSGATDSMFLTAGDVDIGGDDPFSWLVGLLLGLVFVILFAIALAFLLPLILILVGLLVAVVTVAAKLASLSRWQVRATSVCAGLEWRVRGPLRSRRAIHDVARALERGAEPLVDDRPGHLTRGAS